MPRFFQGQPRGTGRPLCGLAWVLKAGALGVQYSYRTTGFSINEKKCPRMLSLGMRMK